jgi:hypothetical protein
MHDIQSLNYSIKFYGGLQSIKINLKWGELNLVTTANKSINIFKLFTTVYSATLLTCFFFCNFNNFNGIMPQVPNVQASQRFGDQYRYWITTNNKPPPNVQVQLWTRKDQDNHQTCELLSTE